MCVENFIKVALMKSNFNIHMNNNVCERKNGKYLPSFLSHLKPSNTTITKMVSPIILISINEKRKQHFIKLKQNQLVIKDKSVFGSSKT